MRKEAVAVCVVIIVVLAFLAGLGSSTLYPAKTVSKTTTVTDTFDETVTDTFAQTVIDLSTTSSATCDYVIPGPCPNGETFTLAVNYTGNWRVTYQGYNAAACSDCYGSSTQTLNGSYDGSGFNSRNFTVGGQGNGWTLCAQAQKSDASSSVLFLNVSGALNETSLAFGTASACSQAIIV
jgi:hypothetical protein